MTAPSMSISMLGKYDKKVIVHRIYDKNHVR